MNSIKAQFLNYAVRIILLLTECKLCVLVGYSQLDEANIYFIAHTFTNNWFSRIHSYGGHVYVGEGCGVGIQNDFKRLCGFPLKLHVAIEPSLISLSS